MEKYEKKDSKNKRYETPVVVPLGEITKGVGQYSQQPCTNEVSWAKSP